MGNTFRTPISHIKDKYSIFISYILMNGNLSQKEKLKQFHEGFPKFLNDFLSNDETFQKYDDDDKISCIGMLLYMQCTHPWYILIEPNSYKCFLVASAITEAIAIAFYNRIPASTVITSYIRNNFISDKEGYIHQYINGKWYRSDKNSIILFDLSQLTNNTCKLHTFKLSNKLVVDGLDAINKYQDKLREECIKFSSPNSKLFENVYNKIILDAVIFNAASTTIPCRTVIVDPERGGIRLYQRDDIYNQRLGYDPEVKSDTLTKCVEKYIGNIKCDREQLANCIVSAGISTISNNRHLTIISGPRFSGKTTLLKVIKALFDQLVYTGEYYTTEDQGRTCLVDNIDTLNEKGISTHPCNHLIVVQDSKNTDNICTIFGGRSVSRLNISEKIENIVTDIVTKISTKKELGVLLGWALKNHNIKIKPDINRKDQIFDKLLDQMKNGTNKLKSPRYDQHPVSPSDINKTGLPIGFPPEMMDKMNYILAQKKYLD